MRLVLLRAGLAAIGIVLFFSIACEEHHVGEYPEVQRDRLAEAKQTTRHKQGDAPSASATPVKFFPEKKSP
jgi:hypothetical protein